MSQQRHEQVIDTLITQIYTKKLKPGTKLPSERQLSVKMNVDRTSLRVALKHLEAMHVLDIRQGDGIYIKDYIENAGLEFLEVLFLRDQVLTKNKLIDEFIIDEIWEFWTEFLPTMLRVAIKKFSARDIKNFMNILNEELENLDDKPKILELEFKSQELVTQVANNIVFSLISNSLRPVRKKMLEIYVTSTDKKILKQHLNIKKGLLTRQFTESFDGADSISEEYRGDLKALRRESRKYFLDSLAKTKMSTNTSSPKKPKQTK